MDSENRQSGVNLIPICIEKVELQLAAPFLRSLQRIVLNERTLDEENVVKRGWEACYLDSGELTRFVASSLIRACRGIGVSALFAVDTVDLFRATNCQLPVRRIPLSLNAISQACFGLPSAWERSEPNFHWFLEKSFGSSLFFSGNKDFSMVVLRDAATCTTIAGDPSLVDILVKRSRRVWFEGIPVDGRKRVDSKIVDGR